MSPRQAPQSYARRVVRRVLPPLFQVSASRNRDKYYFLHTLYGLRSFGVERSREVVLRSSQAMVLRFQSLTSKFGAFDLTFLYESRLRPGLHHMEPGGAHPPGGVRHGGRDSRVSRVDRENSLSLYNVCIYNYMYMYMCIYTYIYIYTYTYICICIN